MAFLLFLTYVAFAGCNRLSTGSLIKPGPREYLQKAERAGNLGKHGDALIYYQRFLEHYPDAQGADKAAAGAGKAYYQLGNYEAAYSMFKGFGERYPDSDRIDESSLYEALCLFHLGRYGESLDLLHSLEKSSLSPALQMAVYFQLGENYAKLKNVLSALHWYEQCHAVAQDDTVLRQVQDTIRTLLRSVNDGAVLAEVISVFPEGYITEVARIEQARYYSQRGQFRNAETLLKKLAESHPNDSLTADIQSTVSSIREESGRHVCTLGCILPLSGEYEPYGRDVLNALLLGARAFEETEKGPVRLVIRDSTGDPKEGMRLVEELASNKDLMGIIGPLLGTVAMACSVKAQELGVPMITLTQKEEVADVGDFIFQNGLTPQQQVETVVRYVMEELGLTKFAVLYPKDSYGVGFRDCFLRYVEEMDGEVVSVVSYEKSETDFQQEIRQLVGETYWTRVQDKGQGGTDVQTIDALHLEAIEKELMGEQPTKTDVYPPPFEALFIPDGLKRVAIIAPHLALYDLTGITLLGTAGWNSPKLVETSGQYVQGAIFADGFFENSPISLVQGFVSTYSEAFQKAPGVLEALGYDSVVMLDESFHRAMHKNRETMREELARIKDFEGLSGHTGFDEKGRATKRLYVLSVRNDQIVQLQ